MAPPLKPDSVNTKAITQGSSTEATRVLSVIPGEADGASFVFAKRQVASLQEAGVICKTFFLPPRTVPARFAGMGMAFAAQTVILTAREWQKFRGEIRTFKPHIVHVHFGALPALFCTISTKLPVVVTYRGSDLIPSPGIPRFLWAAGMLLSQIAALRSSRIICVSQELKRKLWWARSRVTVIPTGIDTKLFYPRPRQEARAELGWGEDERVVLFNSGRTPVRKRLDLAQFAIDVARALCGEIRFVVLDGAVEPNLIPTLMNGADSLLVTSDSEGSPNIVKEALSCNLPVVTVDVGDVRERLANVEPSRIVERDPHQIGRALGEILMKRDRSNGREAIQEVTQERVATRILAVYGDALSEN